MCNSTKLTNRLATPTCPDDYVSAFVAGTEPRDTCDQQSGVAGLFSRVFGANPKIFGERPGPGSERRPTKEEKLLRQNRRHLQKTTSPLLRPSRQTHLPPNRFRNHEEGFCKSPLFSAPSIAD
jgi:hypothetical protein